MGHRSSPVCWHTGADVLHHGSSILLKKSCFFSEKFWIFYFGSELCKDSIACLLVEVLSCYVCELWTFFKSIYNTSDTDCLQLPLTSVPYIRRISRHARILHLSFDLRSCCRIISHPWRWYFASYLPYTKGCRHFEPSNSLSCIICLQYISEPKAREKQLGP